MNPIEKELMMGMIDILNKHSDILTEEQINIRLADLKQFEDETNFIFMNSPTLKEKNIQIRNTSNWDYKKTSNTDEIIELTSQNEVIAYPNLIGTNMSVTYTDGILTYIKIDNLLLQLNEVVNVPYKINKEGTYVVKGKVSNMKFYVHDVIDGRCENVKDSLREVEELGFDIVKYWFMVNFKPKNMQDNIDYVFEYVEEEELSIDGIVFRCNDRDNGLLYVKEK